MVFCGIAIGAAVVRIVLAWFSQRYVFRIGFDIGAALYERMPSPALHFSHKDEQQFALSRV